MHSVKVIASGIITQKMAALLMPGNTKFQEFAYMYGALPVASVCCVFAANYDAYETTIAGTESEGQGVVSCSQGARKLRYFTRVTIISSHPGLGR